MTAPIEEFVRLTKRTQEALASAVQAWQQTARSAVRRPDDAGAGLPDVRATVDAAFTFAARVLADQLEFAKALVSVATPDSTEAPALDPAPRRRLPLRRARAGGSARVRQAPGLGRAPGQPRGPRARPRPDADAGARGRTTGSSDRPPGGSSRTTGGTSRTTGSTTGGSR